MTFLLWGRYVLLGALGLAAGLAVWAAAADRE